MNRNYAEMNDESIVVEIRSGDEDAQDFLLNKYKGLVRAKSHRFFLVGADRDDIIQEGMIGLYKAMKHYQPDKMSSFRTFATLCITQQIMTAVKTASRRKHHPLNTSVSLSASADVFSAQDYFANSLSAPMQENPEEALINREDKHGMEARIGASLSAFECRVLSQHLRGDSYRRIAEAEACAPKAVDNALQRVRRKIERK